MPKGTASLSHPRPVKLATDNYGSDDGGNRSPPLLPRIVALKPPSPEFLTRVIKPSSPEPEAMSATHPRPKRRRKTKASQADAVVIGYMANFNTPEVAARAGEEPLNSASEASESEMGDPWPSAGGGYGMAGMAGHDGLVETAQHALPPLYPEEPREDRAGGARGDGPRPAGASLSTRDFPPSSTDGAIGGAAKTGSGWDDDEERLPPNRQVLFHQGPLRAHNTHGPSTRPTHPFSTRPSQGLRRHSSGNSTLSTLRLPAMHHSPESLSAHSPKEQQTLPPFAHIADLVNGRSPGRPPYPPANEGAPSPAPGPLNPRSGQSSSPPSRINGQFSSHLSVPPWPSTREPYRQPHDAPPLSTPAGCDPSQSYRRMGRTVQSDECPTVPTEAYRSTQSYRKDLLPSRDHINPDAAAPMFQQPAAALPPMTGTFRCEHSDCKAQPFQTQYLLK